MFGSKRDITIEVGRTVSVNFQSRSFKLQINVPESVGFLNACKLGDFLVDAKLLGTWKRGDERKFATDYEACFGGDINDFLDHIEEKVNASEKE